MELILMSIRTREQLQLFFQQSREKKLKEKEAQKRQRQEQYKAMCKQADRLLKEDAERLKKEKMEQLQDLAQKAAQKPQKQPQMAFQITECHTRYIERYTPDEKLYQTREELEKAMPNAINWQKWNEVVEKTQKEIERILM